MKFRIVIAAVILAWIALAVNDARAYSHYTKLDEIATKLAMRPVEYRCLSYQESLADSMIQFWGAAAYVEWDFTENENGEWKWGPKDYAVASFDSCQPLLQYLQGKVVAPSRLAWAVLVLTHESGHLRGMEDEAWTECWAIRHVRYVAQFLGFSYEMALYLEKEALIHDLRLRKKNPEYDRKTCQRPGG